MTGQVDRAVIAARAAKNPRIHTGPNYHLGMAEPVQGRRGRPGRRSRRPGSDKGQGMWRTVSPYYRTMITVDRRWDK